MKKVNELRETITRDQGKKEPVIYTPTEEAVLTLLEDVEAWEGEGLHINQEEAGPSNYEQDNYGLPTLTTSTTKPSRNNTIPSMTLAPPRPAPSPTLSMTSQPVVASSGKGNNKANRTDTLIDIVEDLAMKIPLPLDEDQRPFMAFGEVVSYKLRKMDELQATFAEKLINDALFLGSFNKLTENHHINQ
ncbi:hypothetical protein Pcinc_025127 [Petrolisthes cinctipes]|uniref:Uncharacterized protein n=1 Tax=Petrolisthes cinctipes TaxID=88211 RepID=A0AAE1KC08_PETCI|nr:hypothetical protein Pcinc_025127 [Petrolisthes cinctipes]